MTAAQLRADVTSYGTTHLVPVTTSGDVHPGDLLKAINDLSGRNDQIITFYDTVQQQSAAFFATEDGYFPLRQDFTQARDAAERQTIRVLGPVGGGGDLQDARFTSLETGGMLEIAAPVRDEAPYGDTVSVFQRVDDRGNSTQSRARYLLRAAWGDTKRETETHTLALAELFEDTDGDGAFDGDYVPGTRTGGAHTRSAQQEFYAPASSGQGTAGSTWSGRSSEMTATPL